MGRQRRSIVPVVLLLASASSAGAQGVAPVDFAKKTDVTVPAADVTLAATPIGLMGGQPGALEHIRVYPATPDCGKTTVNAVCPG
jgi:hypothetical protein